MFRVGPVRGSAGYAASSNDIVDNKLKAEFPGNYCDDASEFSAKFEDVWVRIFGSPSKQGIRTWLRTWRPPLRAKQSGTLGIAHGCWPPKLSGGRSGLDPATP
jgi:hypothetical protein